MHEQHTDASTLRSYPNHFVEISDPTDEELHDLLNTVDSFLAANNIDPETVVFAGYDPSRIKNRR